MSFPSRSEIAHVLLQVLAEHGGHARPAEVYDEIAPRFPELSPGDLGAVTGDGRHSLWRNKVAWARNDLVSGGLLDGSEHGVWKLTASGSGTAASGVVHVSPTADADRDGAIVDDDDQQAAPAQDAHAVAAELREASHDAERPTRFEVACADAFRMLGFDATHVGGPSNPDVLVSAPLGVHRYTVVVDAKATTHDRVPNAQINWIAMRNYRKVNGADYACVVGTSFSGGDLATSASEFGIALITVGDLAELLAFHELAPLTLGELRALFASSSPVSTALTELRALSNARRRFQALVGRSLVVIENFSRNQPTLPLARPEALLASLATSPVAGLAGVTPDDAQRVFKLLEALGVLVPAEQDGYYATTTSVTGATRLLLCLAGTVAQPGIQDPVTR